MKKNILKSFLFAAWMMMSAMTTSAQESVTTISGAKTWTFNDMAVGDYISLTPVDGLYMRAFSDGNSRKITVASGSTSVDFGDEHIRIEKYATLPPTTDLANAVLTMTDPSEKVTKKNDRCIAFQTTVPGTVYVAFKTGGENAGCFFSMYADGNEVKTCAAVDGRKNTVWTYQADKGAVFVLGGSIKTNIYAVKFVPTTVTAKVSTLGYATYSSSASLDFTNAQGIEAYKAKVNGDKLELTKVDKVPANTGIILKATSTLTEETSFTIPTTTEEVTALKGNDLLPAVNETTLTAADNAYGLTDNNGTAVFGKVTAAVTIPAGMAYLKMESTDQVASQLSFVFADPTAISHVNTVKTHADEAYYTLNGMRVNKPEPGKIYVKNGKTVIYNK